MAKKNIHILVIRPAIIPKERHRIEKVLEEMGYIVTGGGTARDMTQSDITFEGEYKMIKKIKN